MLELKEITKTYPAGGEHVEALRGIDLQFRSNEFVSVLGPSGCGKTTLLNIIGGLDQYTSGDLVINGRSTRDYSDRDWDTYRNHSIGFVFQSYNLIPHQTVLQNVELALTLSGVPQKERRERARVALEKVGLGKQLRKRPSEMSGGQMQRVAIARAIVNDPDIILADEPTGALDTETSVQVMDILKEIAKDRLVIMVTHNPDLAEKYSTRIIRMLDGKITDDSAPLSLTDLVYEHALEQGGIHEAAQKKPSMSFRTAFGLSLRNLFTKKGRTVLTSFAGSIGIIGIALIYAVSNGMTGFINSVQEDTLSSYPLTLEQQHVDMSSLMQTFMGKAQSASAHEDDGVYQKTMIYEMLNAMNSVEAQQNNLTAFKAYLEAQRADPSSDSPLRTAVSGVQYTYDTDLLVYTRNVDGDIIASDPKALMQDLLSGVMQTDLSAMMALRDQMASGTGTVMMDSATALWREMLPGENGRLISPLFKKQYDLVYGSWPTRYDEIMLVVDEDGELPDLMLYALGLLPKADIENLMQAAMIHQPVEASAEKWSYADICGLDFRVILNADCYVPDQANGRYTDLRDTAAGLQYLYDNALRLRVCGILKPKADAVATMLTGGIGYTSQLTEYIIRQSEQSEAVQAQINAPGIDILTGFPFKNQDLLTDTEKAAAFRAWLGAMNDEEKAAVYKQIMSIPSKEIITQTAAQQMAGMTRDAMEAQLAAPLAAQMNMAEDTVGAYLASMEDEALNQIYMQLLTQQIEAQYADQIQEQLGGMTTVQLAALLDQETQRYSDTQCAALYDAMMTFSDSTYEQNLKALGCVDLEHPATINLYASTFEGKDQIEQAIADYNASVSDLEEITYTDYVGLMMSSVTTIINAITYVLIAFVAISLVVSSIMIGVITLISVQERTKEIGILRAIGASKKNVSSMFNAETVIIGFTSGTLGVLITYLLCILVNAILHHLTGIGNLSAALPLRTALILICISMLLTLIAGIIPSRSAAKKDPVVALRTE